MQTFLTNALNGLVEEVLWNGASRSSDLTPCDFFSYGVCILKVKVKVKSI